MGREYEWLFGALPKKSAPAYLCERVLDAIHRERVRLVRTRLVFSSCALVASLVGSVVAVRALIEAMIASGFTTYASLAVTDSGTVFTSGSSFFLTLLESLPGPEVVASLAFLAILIQSMRVALASGIAWAYAPKLA
jgi:hypothetical protein